MDEVRFLKKTIFLVLAIAIFAMISSANAQLTAVHETQSDVEFGQEFTGKIVVIPTEETDYDAALELPVTWLVTDWSVSGNQSQVKFEHLLATLEENGGSRVYEIYHFYGTDSEQISIMYTVKPASTGTHTVTARVIYPEGFISRENEINVFGEPIVVPGSQCGNNICEGAYGESLFTCYADCPFRFADNILIWIVILLIALMIAFIGIGYKIHKKRKKLKGIAMAKPIYGEVIETPKSKVMPMPVKPMMGAKSIMDKLKELPLPPPIFGPASAAPKPKTTIKKAKKPAKRAVKRVIPKSVKRRTKKRVVKAKATKKKVKKQTKAKKTAKKRAKHTDFYSSTMSRLEKIRKSLK